jgi:hypothetical protein
MIGTMADSNLVLVSGTTTVSASYSELCQFFFQEDPEHPTESFRRLMTLADPMTDDVRHLESFIGSGVVCDETGVNPRVGAVARLPLFAARWASFHVPFPLWTVRALSS